MQAIQVIQGATAPDDAKTYKISPEGKALASIPGWVLFIDPSYVNTTDKTVLNRAKYNSNLVSDTTNPVYVPVGTFANGASAFAPIVGTTIRLNPQIAFPQNEWSVVFVAKPEVKTTGNANSIVTSNTLVEDADLFAINVAITADAKSVKIRKQGAVSEGSAGRLIYTSPTSLSEETAVYIATFSTKNGLSIYKNGVKVASNTDDKAPINAQFGAGDWHVLRGALGQYGHVGVLSIDLNDSVNEAYREKINAFLMQKYIL